MLKLWKENEPVTYDIFHLTSIKKKHLLKQDNKARC